LIVLGASALDAAGTVFDNTRIDAECGTVVLSNVKLGPHFLMAGDMTNHPHHHVALFASFVSSQWTL